MIKPTLKNTQYNINNLFSTLKELSVKNKTLLQEEKELQKEIFTEQILSILKTTYDLINHLEEKKALNNQFVKFEKNRDSIDQTIESYQVLAQKALEDEDKNLHWRHLLTTSIYETFKRDSNQAKHLLATFILTNIMLDSKEFTQFYMQMMLKFDPLQYEKSLRNYQNKDLFISLFFQLDGYEVTHKKILKTGALKIFDFFNTITYVQKKALADKIEHIFASLGEDVSVDPKRACYIVPVGTFNKTILYDYRSNQKKQLKGYGMDKIYEVALNSLITTCKKTKNREVLALINKNRKQLEKQFIQQLLF